ncbi:unnamed protein product [Cylindrotheca closterium]|uniref:Procollagen-proline 4-dioxygenase n=1 Tax=Cylindrotheca closterium TaxID=2856 RepID=A0AAD2G3E8_9STRA|nr:unnamed protein product [Cylindrotheca closterium]
MKVWNATIFLVLSLCLLVIAPGALAAVKGENSGTQATLEDEETCSSEDGGTCASSGEAVVQVEDLSRCEDRNDGCRYWADSGECLTNPRYMWVYCALSCGKCQVEEDIQTYGEGDIDMGVEQGLGSASFSPDKVLMAIAESEHYLKTTMMKQSIRNKCKNTHADCTVWALDGECEENPGYMKMNCAPACQSCYYLSTETRCPIDPEAPLAWQAGDLDRMFQKLTQEPYLTKYNVTILASPNTNGPWVITMENLIQPDEADRLIALGQEMGFERSKGMAKIHPDGTPEHVVSDARTSTQTWCREDCSADPMSRQVIERLSNLTGIDEMNSEYLQLLEYEPGQYYHNHHDYLANELKRQQGVRILTVYLYLNNVEEGGGTEFDQLGITVMPKKGMALLWPSVLNENTAAKDERTTHAALPVIKGMKYGANAWFHLRDFKTPHGNHCTE